jgi:hypothetical protein
MSPPDTQVQLPAEIGEGPGGVPLSLWQAESSANKEKHKISNLNAIFIGSSSP